MEDGAEAKGRLSMNPRLCGTLRHASGWSYGLDDFGKFAIARHDEKALAAASGLPDFADGTLFLRINAVVKMLSFVLHRQGAAVGQLADEIRVKPIC